MKTLDLQNYILKDQKDIKNELELKIRNTPFFGEQVFSSMEKTLQKRGFVRSSRCVEIAWAGEQFTVSFLYVYPTNQHVSKIEIKGISGESFLVKSVTLKNNF